MARDRTTDGSTRTGICFDLDGVLWDTAAAHAAAFEEVSRTNGLVAPPYGDLAGRPTPEAWRVILQANGRRADGDTVARLSASKQARARHDLAAAPPLFPDIGALAALTGVSPTARTALVTGSSAATVQVFLDAIRPVWAFDAVVTAEDVAMGKPSPEPYLAAATALGVEPGACWVLEDSRHGLASATAAGSRVAHLARRPCEFGHARGDGCVADLGSFVALVLDHGGLSCGG